MRKIEPYALWIGHAGDLANVSVLGEAGIRAVIDLALNEPPARMPRDWVHCRIPLLDGPDNDHLLLRLAIETTAALIRSAAPVLIACSNGMSRSPCIASAALTLVEGSGLHQILSRIAALGPLDVTPGLLTDVESVLQK